MNFLLINKPGGWTSFDAVAYIRKQYRAEHPEEKKIKVGHAGTLDPFATGLLIIGVGREAIKKLDEFKKLPKTYIATIKLGEISDTYDRTGNITVCHSEPPVNAARLQDGEESLKLEAKVILRSTQNDSQPAKPSLEKINQIIGSFTGKQLQIPPMFSAKKINGQRLYKLARQGIAIERQPNEIEIYEIKLLEYTWPILKIEVQCSAGTYIRTLAHDIDAKLGTGAYCQELVRTQIGDYSLKNAINIK